MRANRVLQIVSCKYTVFAKLYLMKHFVIFATLEVLCRLVLLHFICIVISIETSSRSKRLSPCSNNIVFILSNDIGVTLMHSKQYFVKAT